MPISGSYTGPLTPKQIADGIAAAQSNALRLLEDATILFEAKRFPSAVALAILSMEERGKVIILKRLAGIKDPSHVKSVWRDYRSHRAKNSGWIIPHLAVSGVNTLSGMKDAVDSKAEHTEALDSLKQISFYTDCLGKINWSIPEVIIDAELAETILKTARMMWGGKEVTVRAIELWAEIVAPHYNKTNMPQAVIEWHGAMVSEGLSSMDSEVFAAFLMGQPFRMGAADGDKTSGE